MGFYEDDRIRGKNAAINAAHETYQDLKTKFWSDTDIINWANGLLVKNSLDRAAYELLKMAVANSNKPTHNQD